MPYLYTLESFDPLSYPSIENVCTKNILEDTNKVIFFKNSPEKLYRLNLVGEDVGLCESFLPAYIVSDEVFPQPIEYKVYSLDKCTNPPNNIEAKLTGVPVVVGDVVKIEGYTDCYEVSAEIADTGQASIEVFARYDSCAECGADPYYTFENCETLAQVVGVASVPVAIGDILEVAELAGCWKVIGVSTSDDLYLTVIRKWASCAECLEGNPYFRLVNCNTGESRLAKIAGGSPSIGDVISVSENTDCWEVVSRAVSAIVSYTYTGTLANCESCAPALNCDDDGERTLAFANMVKLPTPATPNKGFKECCYTNLVLADEADDDPYKNDFTGVFFKRQTAGDSCDFIIHELDTGNTYALNSSIYGEFKDFGDIAEQPNLKTYILRWRKVLAVLGAGNYQIEKDITIAGLSFSELSNTFTLKTFSNTEADKTVRIETKINGELVHFETDFKGSEFETSIRTKGFFGRRNPTYEQDNLVKRNYKTVQISMSQKNEYEFQAGLIPYCITKEILDFVLFGDELFISDYNLINHSYELKVLPVELESNKGTNYYTTNRDARINFVFVDRFKNKRKLNC